MSRPLPPGESSQLGPFRLSARLSEPPAGIVYLGVDPQGGLVSIAVLNQGAAADAAARDRFRAAIVAELDRGAAGGVVGAEPEGPAPWVAVRYEAERATAERFLERVLLTGRSGGGSGPWFQPHWAGSREPALPWLVARREQPGEPVAARWPLWWAPALVAGLVVLALLLMVLFACEPSMPRPVPVPVPSPPSDRPSSEVSPFPVPPPPPLSPHPSLTPSRGSGSPGPSGSATDSGGGLA